MAGISASGGSIQIGGTLTNTGQTLSLTASTGSWALNAGTIRGGSITFAGGSSLQYMFLGGTLDGVALDGEIVLDTESAKVTVQGSTSFHAVRLREGGATFRTNGFYSLVAPVFAEGPAIGPRFVNATGQLTIGPEGLITLAEDCGGPLEVSGTGTLVNTGVINVPGGATLSLMTIPFINTGAVIVSGGVLNLGGATVTQFLNLPGFDVTGGGTVLISGVLNNGGATLTLTPSLGSWILSGGTIVGGTVAFSGGAKLGFSLAGGTLDGVAVLGDLDLSAASSKVRLNGTTSFNRAYLRATGTSITLGTHYTLNSEIVALAASAIFTSQPAAAISTTGRVILDSLSTGPLEFSGPLLNYGLISARSASQPLIIGTLTNYGTLEVDGGNIIPAGFGKLLNVQGQILTGGTYRVANGGSININQDLILTLNAALIVDGASNPWPALNSMQAVGAAGSLTLLSGADLTLTPQAGTLTNSGVFTLGPGSTLTVSGHFTQSSAGVQIIQIAGTDPATFGALHVSGAVSLDGTLRTTPVGGYQAARGDVQQFLTSGGPVLGSFSSLQLAATADPALKTVLVATPNGLQLLTTSLIDFDNDGEVNLSDFFAFFNAFDSGDPLADIDGNPGVDLGDFFLFFNIWSLE